MVRYFGQDEGPRRRRSLSPRRGGYGGSKRERSPRRRSPPQEASFRRGSDRDRRPPSASSRLDRRPASRGRRLDSRRPDPAPHFRRRSDDGYSDDDSRISNYSSDVSDDRYRPNDRYRRDSPARFDRRGRDDDYRPRRPERRERSYSPQERRRSSPPPPHGRRDESIADSKSGGRTREAARVYPTPLPINKKWIREPQNRDNVESVCGMLFPECDSLKPNDILKAEFHYFGNVSEHRAVFKSISNTTNIRSQPKEPIRPHSKKDKAAMMSFWEGDVKDLRSLMGKNSHPFRLALLQEAKRLKKLLGLDHFLLSTKRIKTARCVGSEYSFDKASIFGPLGTGKAENRPRSESNQDECANGSKNTFSKSPSQSPNYNNQSYHTMKTESPSMTAIKEDIVRGEDEDEDKDEDGFFTSFDFGGGDDDENDEEGQQEEPVAEEGEADNDNPERGGSAQSVHDDSVAEVNEDGCASPVPEGSEAAEGEEEDDAAARAREARPDVDEDTTFNVGDYPLEDEDGADLEEEERKLAAEYLNANINFADMLDDDQEGAEADGAQPDAEGDPSLGKDRPALVEESQDKIKCRQQQQLHHLLCALELMFKMHSSFEACIRYLHIVWADFIEFNPITGRVRCFVFRLMPYSMRRLCVRRLSETLTALGRRRDNLGRSSVLEQLNEPFPPWAAPSVFDKHWDTFPDLAACAYESNRKSQQFLKRLHVPPWKVVPSPQLHVMVCPEPVVAFVTEHYIAGNSLYLAHKDKLSRNVVPVVHNYKILGYPFCFQDNMKVVDGSNTYDRVVEELARPASQHEGTSALDSATIRDAVSMSYAYRRLLIDRFLVTNSRSVMSRHYHKGSSFRPHSAHNPQFKPEITGLVAALSGGWHDPEVDPNDCVATTPIDVLIVRSLNDITDQLPLARYAHEMECVARERANGRRLDSTRAYRRFGRIRFTGVYVEVQKREHMENVGIGCVAPALEACMIHRNRLYAIEAEKTHPKPPAKYFSEMFRSKHMFPLPSIFSDLAPLGNYREVASSTLGPFDGCLEIDNVRGMITGLLTTTTSPSPAQLHTLPHYTEEAISGRCPFGDRVGDRLHWLNDFVKSAKTFVNLPSSNCFIRDYDKK